MVAAEASTHVANTGPHHRGITCCAHVSQDPTFCPGRFKRSARLLSSHLSLPFRHVHSRRHDGARNGETAPWTATSCSCGVAKR